MGNSVCRSCPLTFNLFIISDHWQLRLLDYIVGSSVGSSNAEKVVGSWQLQLSMCSPWAAKLAVTLFFPYGFQKHLNGSRIAIESRVFSSSTFNFN